jgi:hypothetical protein
MFLKIYDQATMLREDFEHAGARGIQLFHAHQASFPIRRAIAEHFSEHNIDATLANRLPMLALLAQFENTIRPELGYIGAIKADEEDLVSRLEFLYNEMHSIVLSDAQQEIVGRIVTGGVDTIAAEKAVRELFLMMHQIIEFELDCIHSIREGVPKAREIGIHFHYLVSVREDEVFNMFNHDAYSSPVLYRKVMAWVESATFGVAMTEVLREEESEAVKLIVQDIHNPEAASQHRELAFRVYQGILAKSGVFNLQVNHLQALRLYDAILHNDGTIAYLLHAAAADEHVALSDVDLRKFALAFRLAHQHGHFAEIDHALGQLHAVSAISSQYSLPRE